MTSKNKYLLNKVKLRASRFVGQRLLSILVLLGLAQLGIKDLVNFLLDLDLYPRDNKYGPLLFVVLLLLLFFLANAFYNFLWTRTVTIEDLGDKVRIELGSRQYILPWSSLRKVRLDRTTSRGKLVSVDLILAFESRSFRFTKDQPVAPLSDLEAYMQAKLKKAKS